MILTKQFNPFTTHNIKYKNINGLVTVWNNYEMGCVMSSELSVSKTKSKFNSWVKSQALKRRLLKSKINYGYESR